MEAMILAAVLLLQSGLIAALLIERRLRRRTAAALADSEQRISLAARAARLSPFVWGLAPDGNPCRPASHEESATAKQIAGSLDQILQTAHPADRERFGRAVREAAASGAELDVEYRELQPDGETRWFVARGRVAAGEPDCLTGVKMDVTARKTAELQSRADREASPAPPTAAGPRRPPAARQRRWARPATAGSSARCPPSTSAGRR